MTLRLVRRIAVLLIAFYAFAQAGMVMAACDTDRGAMVHAMAMPMGDTCDDCVKANGDTVTAVCYVHCTVDSQLTSAPGSSTIAPPAATPFVAPPAARYKPPPIVVHAPPGTLPRRILLHSFQV